MGRFFAATAFMAVFILGIFAATTLAGKSELKDGKGNPPVPSAKDETVKKPSEGVKQSRLLETDDINDAVNSAIENAKSDPSYSKNEASLTVSKTAGKPGVVSGHISQS